MRTQKSKSRGPPRSSVVYAGVAAVAAGGVALAQPPMLGLTLHAAIEKLEDAGLRVFYSTDVVKPSMRVLAQPSGADARDWLRELVAPHGLGVVPGPRDSVLIVRAAQPAPSPAAAPPEPAARSPAPPQPPPTIEEIVVAASRYELARAAAGQPFRLSTTDIEALPDLGDDSLRAVQRLPGAAGNGFNARANVRGGEVGELLVRLDELRLYDPYHLEDFQGIFSSIDPRIVSTMDVYTGGFPVQFGDRMSGVIDVASFAPSTRRYHELGVSFFNASALSAGRFGGDGEWVASVRRSNLDLLYSAFSGLPERPRYLDAFGKVSYRISDSLRVTMNALYSRDDVSLSDDLDVEEHATSRQEDRYGWLRFEHTPRQRLSGTTLLAHTTLAGQRTGATAKPGVSEGWLFDQRDFAIDTLQSDWSWRPTGADRWSIQFGGLLGRMRGRYEYRAAVEYELLLADSAADELELERDVQLAPRGEEHALYGSVRFEPSARLALDVGARWDRQTLEPGAEGSIAPRVSLRYDLGERTALLASGGRFEQAQAISELQVSDGEQRYFAPQRSRHAVLGLEHALPNGVQLRIELYEKEMSRLRPRFENVLQTLTLLPELKPDRVRIAPDSALARGLELLVSDGSAARFDWWASYSRGRVRDSLAGVDVPRSWDQTHAIAGGLGWETPRWNVSMAATYRSGWPRTAIVGVTRDAEIAQIVTGPRNAERVGAFRSVDLRVTRAFSVWRGELSAFLELTNSFDRDNECCVEYELEHDELGEPELGLSRLGYLPRVPSLGFLWSF
jgi:outer membrane receptor protein involved in Fe transport